MTTTMTPSRPPSAAPDATLATPPPRDIPVTRRAAAGDGRPAGAASPVDLRDLSVPGGPAGQLRMRIFRPAGTTGALPVVLYVHGHCNGNSNGDGDGDGDGPHDLAGRLAIDLRCAVVVSACGRAATAAGIDQLYAAASWIAASGGEHGLDRARVAVVADSAGAAAADELMLMADRRGGPALAARVLLSARTMAVLRAALAA